MATLTQPLSPVTSIEVFLTPASVRTWAQGLSATDTLGLAAVAWDCPLARFCQQVLGYKVHMERRNFWVTGDSTAGTLPVWARRFIYVIDTCFTPGTAVTAAQVLTALDDAERWAAEETMKSVSWPEIQAMAAATPASLKKAWQPAWANDINHLQVFANQPASAAVKTEEKVLVPA